MADFFYEFTDGNAKVCEIDEAQFKAAKNASSSRQLRGRRMDIYDALKDVLVNFGFASINIPESHIGRARAYSTSVRSCLISRGLKVSLAIDEENGLILVKLVKAVQQ